MESTNQIYSPMKWIIRIIFLTLLQFFVLHSEVIAQNAPITTAATVGGAVSGQNIAIPITVTGFTSIGSVTLTLQYDTTLVHFVSGVGTTLLANNFAIGDNSIGNGIHQVVMGWYGPGSTVANNTAIFTLTFNYISGSPLLQFIDNGPSCNYANGVAVVLNDTPTSTYYHNGMICPALANPGSITGDNIICAGETGVAYSISPIPNVTGYNWTVPTGASVSGGSGTNAITVDYSLGASTGNVTVCGVNLCGNGPSSSLPITVTSYPVAYAGNDTTINYGTTASLHAASGGIGSFSYHWSPENLLVNPDVQNPVTVQLTNTTNFNLVVTNLLSQCQSSDAVVVAITGGPLSINPMAFPDHICWGETSQLMANAGGGTGNYSYSWTCTPPGNPPWSSNIANPAVNPDTSTQYFLTVNDGFGNLNGSTAVTVNYLPGATISGGDSICDDGSYTTLAIDLTGTPPWSFTYGDGINNTTIHNQLTTPYEFNTSEEGTYTVTYVHDMFCTGNTYGSATVWVFPVPSAPVITEDNDVLSSESCCGNQWYLENEPIPGADGQQYTATENGKYFDIVTLNGCISDTSNILDVVITNTYQKMANTLQIFPNPAKDYFSLRSPEPLEENMRMTIFSSDGVLMREFNLSPGIYRHECLVDIRDLAPGLYFIMIKMEASNIIQKLIIL
jgi:hypothetical protein